MSEVSDETCDVAAYLCSVDQAAAGGQAGKQGQPKTLRLPGHVLSPAVGNSRSGTALAGPPAAAQPQGRGVSSTAMGPPASSAPQTLPLGSLLVAAQMAAGSPADGSSGGPGRGNSPLLLTTQATLQATTASVVAAEVLAAVNRPGGIHSISAACAAPGVSAAALAGLLAGSLGTAGVAQQQELTSQQTTPAQPEHHPAAASGAAQGPDTPQAVQPKASAAAAAAGGELASAQAAAAPAQLQVPSWLSQTSPELKASQAICKASLDTATAALLRLSSPKALCPSSATAAAAASAPAAGGHMGAGALPLAAFTVGQPALTAAGAGAAAPALWGPSLLPSSPTAVPAAAAVPAAVFGIPARDVAAGKGVAWGLPVGTSAAAVAASSTAALLSAQHQVAAAAAAANTLVCLPPLTVGRSAHAAEASDTADAGSCCSSPKAAAAAAAGSAGDAATARLAAAALRLAAHSVESQPGCVSGACSPRCSSSSAALTADDASSPAASEGRDAAVSPLLKAVAVPTGPGGPAAAVVAAAVDLEDEEAAVVVHVEVSRSKGGAAAPAVKQLQQLC